MVSILNLEPVPGGQAQTFLPTEPLLCTALTKGLSTVCQLPLTRHWVQVDFDEKRHVNEPSEAQVRLLTWCGLWVRVSHIGGPIELSNPENLRGGAGGRPGSDAGFGPLPASLLVVSKPWCSYLEGSGVDEVMNLG